MAEAQFGMYLDPLNKKKMKEQVDYITIASNKAKGKRPYFFEDPAVERVLNITMAVASELAVARERIDSLERLLEDKGILTKEEVENYTPTSSKIEEERQLWHSEYISRILRIVQQEMEELKNPDKSLREIADDIDKM